MKKEAKLLLGKSLNSLTLAVQHFNSPFDTGRQEAVLILLDHACEMLLKAAIVHRGGRIRSSKNEHTFGYEKCVQVGRSDGQVKFLDDNQALTLQMLNSLRDAAQHHLVEVSEGQLYVHAQSTVTLMRDVLKDVFQQDLQDVLPRRALPLATSAPTDVVTLFDTEIKEVAKLLAPGKRKRTEARARLKPLAILNKALEGEKGEPTDRDLNALIKRVAGGSTWQDLFGGAAQLTTTSGSGDGPEIAMRITRKEGVPIYQVPEGTPGAYPVAVRHVREQDRYSLSHTDLRKKLGLRFNQTTALIWYLGIKRDPALFKEIAVGKSTFPRYSEKALKAMKEAIDEHDLDEVWTSYRAHVKGQPRTKG
ncbi:MAG: DUF3644 domain-containing protein [Phycisphaerales bacterium JB060]